MRRFASLRRRADFSRVRRYGRRRSPPNLTLYMLDAIAGQAAPLVGITVGKAVGGAVVRNRTRRRISSILQALFAEFPPPGRLLVVVRPDAAAAPFEALQRELIKGLA